jgi:hypothetical protein
MRNGLRSMVSSIGSSVHEAVVLVEIAAVVFGRQV